MHTLVQKPKVTQRTPSAKSTVADRVYLGAGLVSTPLPRFVHDFSQIPVHPKPPACVQAKLRVNPPGDSYEQEADRVAEQVMSTPEPRLQRACACGSCCQGQAEQPDEDPQPLQTKHAGSSGPGQTEAPPIIHEALASPGQPLDLATRAFMEPRFGHDFSTVRVHTDKRAEMSARAIDAHAYTVGKDIVFGRGGFDSNATEGRRLLAHELTHVIQQTAGDGQMTLFRQPAGSGPSQPKSDQKDKPKYPTNCHTGCAGHWGQDTLCSKWGFASDVRDYGGEKWKEVERRGGWGMGDYCVNSWPFALEQYATKELGLDGAASCTSTHEREVATVTLAGSGDPIPIKVLCSDTICGDATKCKTSFGESNNAKACLGRPTHEVIELSPNAMNKLAGSPVATVLARVCYSGSKEDLLPSNGPSRKRPEMKNGDCLTKGCTPDKDTPKLTQTGWPPS